MYTLEMDQIKGKKIVSSVDLIYLPSSSDFQYFVWNILVLSLASKCYIYVTCMCAK